MAFAPFERRLSELRKIRVGLTARPDFNAFWATRLKQVKTLPLRTSTRRVDTPLTRLSVEELEFDGCDGTRIHALKVLPHPLPKARIPMLVRFHGYTGYSGRAHSSAAWACMGVGVLSVDARLQGAGTGSARGFDSSACTRIATMGIMDEKDYYLERHYTDSMRAVEAARRLPEADPARIAIEGCSQGGGTVMAVAALMAGDVFAAMADVPSYSHFEKRVFDMSGSLADAAEYLRRFPERLDRVLRTLTYFDTVNLARRIRCPVLVCCGLRDTICPPENVFATYNRVRSPKRIEVYPFMGHADGGDHHAELKFRWLAELLAGRRRGAQRTG